MLSCEFCEISKNAFFYRTPLVAAFVNENISWDYQIPDWIISLEDKLALAKPILKFMSDIVVLKRSKLYLEYVICKPTFVLLDPFLINNMLKIFLKERS